METFGLQIARLAFLHTACNRVFSFALCYGRAIAGNTSHIKIFLILCMQLVLCIDCHFFLNKIDMSPRSIFHNLTWKFSAHEKIVRRKPMSLILSSNSRDWHPASLFQS